jgi:hypothetical protein
MNIVVDQFFFRAFAESVLALIFVVAVIAGCIKFPKAGKWIWVVFVLLGGTYDLAMCSELIAKVNRQQEELMSNQSTGEATK